MSNPTVSYLPAGVLEKATQACDHLFDKACCTKFLHNFDFYNEQCLKLFTIKLLGYGIIVAGSAVKLPQVFKIFGARSGVGLSLFGVLLELMAITFNSCYSFRNNFPISAWGESIFIGIETALIAFMVLWYDKFKLRALSFLAIYPSLVYVLIQPSLVSKESMWWLQSSVLYLAVSGKLMQAFKNYQAEHTGQISAITAGAIFAGSFTRIFTTIQETGDKLTTITFICATLANAVIAFQVFWYWNLTKKFLEKGKKKKAN